MRWNWQNSKLKYYGSIEDHSFKVVDKVDGVIPEGVCRRRGNRKLTSERREQDIRKMVAWSKKKGTK